MVAANAHKARASASVAANIELDAALASTLEMMQSYEQMEKGITEIPDLQPIQSVPSKAFIRSTQAAPVKALTAPPTAKIQAVLPKAALAKTSSKRPAPGSKEVGPAAKRQKIKKSLAAKASLLAEKKKEEEEEKQKEAQRREAHRHARMKKVEERTIQMLNENMLVQASLMRSGYIPFTPDESEVCYLEADVEACKKTIRAMDESTRYTQEEKDFIRKFVNGKMPIFNSEQSEKFRSLLKELPERSFVEIEQRRDIHLDARFIEDFISDELKENWDVCRVKFIKAYYFWKVVPGQDSVSKFDGLHNFMVLYHNKLWRMILIEAEVVEPKIIIKIPERMLFPKPRVPGSKILDRRIIDDEIDEALEMERQHRESIETAKSMKPKVLSAYIIDES